MVDPLLDKSFLLKLDQYRHKEVYAKVITLSVNGEPVSEITGNVTGGTVNINGSSAVRRTCNLTLVTNNIQVNDLDWGLRTKFKLSIGLKNFVDPQYDDIIWFPLGEYVLTSFSSSLTSAGFSMSISGKDKMCLLNGEVGGALFASHDFGTIYTYKNDGTIIKDKIPIYEIIREAVHVYAQEPYSKIIINDLDTCGVELLDYIGHKSIMYVFEQRLSDDGIWTSQIAFSGTPIGSTLENIWNNNDKRTDDFYTDENGNLVSEIDARIHFCKRVDPDSDINTTVGYRAVDLTYNDDLIVDIGGTITSMLDKIVKMLGEFEYYYDTSGNFIFQRKKIYFNSSWSNAITNENETYYDTIANSSANVYSFMSGYLVESFQNKPQMNAIRNDFAVWGKRTNGFGKELPIHLRYAIDVKPQIYYSLTEDKLFVADTYSFVNSQGKIVTGPYDWRELIYQMAKDNLNKGYQEKINNMDYIDELIADLEDGSNEKDGLLQLKELWRNEHTEVGFNTGYDAYYADMLAFWPQLYRTSNKINYIYNDDGTIALDDSGNPIYTESDLTAEEWSKWQKNYYWNPDLFTVEVDKKTGNHSIAFRNPEKLIFWIDFLDNNEYSALYQYSVPIIGRRAKTVNDDQVKAIYFRDTPNLLFVNEDYEDVPGEEKLAYVKINIVPPYSNYLKRSSQGKSAKEVLDNMVYESTYFQESITFSSIPIYYLEPNTRIQIQDDSTGINGEYLIQSLNISLAYNGMMTVNATRVADRII